MTALYRVTIKALGPLMLGSGPEAANEVESLRYVPGSMLRGALASAWVMEFGKPHEKNPDRADFIALFEQDMIYGPSHAMGSSVVGLSELILKYGDPATNPGRLDRADSSNTNASERGYEQGKGQILGVPTTTTTTTALNDNETASEGNLFSREAIDTDTVFEGNIVGSHPFLDKIDAGNGIRIRLGGRRSVGGAALLQLTKGSSTPLPAAAGNTDRVVRLLSPAILIDNFTAPRSTFLADDFAEVLGCDIKDVKIQRQWTRPTVISGWHTAAGLPKPQERALSLGSTVVLQAPATANFTNLSVVGIGLRRTEGFGAVIVDPESLMPTNHVVSRSSNLHDSIQLFEHLRQPQVDWAGLDIKALLNVVRSILDPEICTLSIDDLLASRKLRSLNETQRATLKDMLNMTTRDLQDLASLLNDHLQSEGLS